MKFKIFNILLFLLVYYTAEELILKWLPVSELVYLSLRFTGEVILYVLLSYVFITKRLTRSSRITLFDILLALFVIVAITSALVNGSSYLSLLMKLRGVIRYVSVFYILLFIKIDGNDVKRLTKALVLLLLIQFIIGLYQHFVLGGYSKFWLPRGADLEIAGIKRNFRALKGLAQGVIIGTFGESVSLGIFMVIISSVLAAFVYNKRHSNKKTTLLNRKWFYLLLPAPLVIIFFTYSRASILGYIIVLVSVFFFSKNTEKLIHQVLFYGFIILLSSPLLIFQVKDSLNSSSHSPIGDFLDGFSSSYLEGEASNNRLWMINTVGGTAVREFKLFGYGSEEEQVRESLYHDGVNKRIINYPAFEDVYWVTLLLYFGILGVLLFLLILKRIYSYSSYVFKHDHDLYFSSFGLALKGFLPALFFLSFFVVTFEFRPVAYTFWMMSGIVANRFYRLKHTQNSLYNLN